MELHNTDPMTMYEGKIYSIIVAAGSGTRFGSKLPKQFCELQGLPVVMHAIRAMRRAIPEAVTAVVVSADAVELWRGLCAKYDFESPTVAIGGSTRWQSVKHALTALGITEDTEGIVAIHDGARPLPPVDMIQRAIHAMALPLNGQPTQGVIPAIAVTDSLRVTSPDGSSEAVDRSRFRAVQTPQVFDARLLARAYTLPYDDRFTDDASVMAAAGFRSIAIVEGDNRNLKITHPDDIRIAEILTERR